MNVHEWLEQIEKIDELISSTESEIQRTFGKATNKVSSLDGMPRSSGVSDKVGDNAVKLVALEKKKKSLESQKEYIIKILERLPTKEYGVLHRRYVRYMKLEDIAAEMNYSTVHVWRIEQKALEILKGILAKEKGDRSS